ncbi:Uncharacterised protein [Escherichia coli]|nr:Uncharacterised protein [Escherichia coli]
MFNPLNKSYTAVINPFSDNNTYDVPTYIKPGTKVTVAMIRVSRKYLFLLLTITALKH